MITATALVLLMIPGVGLVETHPHYPFSEILIRLQLLLLWIGAQKISTVAIMAVCHGYRGCLLPVVFLGLLAGFFAQGRKVHWSIG